MSAQTINVFIDPVQLPLQQNNGYSLYLAKMVNNAFTVIWQSMGPVATPGNPSYEYNNTFDIAVPDYQLNYTTSNNVQGPVQFSASGLPVTMSLGQIVTLSAGGEFGTPSNTGGTAGNLTITNSMQDNPREILCDSAGNPLFFNRGSGMDVGTAVLTPIDTYQLWFGSLVQTGTIIANNVSNVGTVVFDGTDSQTISFTSTGTWEAGPLGESQRRERHAKTA